MYSTGQSSTYQPYESVGALSMVSVPQIQQEEDLDYLQNLCGFIDKMNINPLWHESETPDNRLKLLEIYQTAINYSTNLSQAYHKQISELEERTRKQREQNDEKQNKIRRHKAKVEQMKEKFRKHKHKYYKHVYKNLKHKLREDEEEMYDRRHRKEASMSSQQPEIVYYQMQGPPPPHPSHPPHYYPNQQQPEMYRHPNEGHPEVHHQPQYPLPGPPQTFPPHQSGQQAYNGHNGNVPPQGNQNPGFFGDQFREGFTRLIDGASQTREGEIHGSRDLPRPDSNNLKPKTRSKQIKITEKSILFENEEELIKKEIQNSKTSAKGASKSIKIDSSKQKTSVKKPEASEIRSSIEPYEELPDLMASSKKNKEPKQLSSKKSLSSEGGENPTSISEIKLAVISKTNLVTKFESNKNREKQKSPTNSQKQKQSSLRMSQSENPFAAQRISFNQEVEDFYIGDSNIKKSQSSGKQQTMGGRPQRASQMESLQRKKKAQQLKTQDMDDELGWDLGGKSTINNKKEAKVEDSLGFDLIGDSNISKKKEKEKTASQDFGDIGQSYRLSKGQTSQISNKSKMYDQAPARNSRDTSAKLNKSKFAQMPIGNSSTSNQELAKPQNYGDIFKSNVGGLSNHAEQKYGDISKSNVGGPSSEISVDSQAMYEGMPPRRNSQTAQELSLSVQNELKTSEVKKQEAILEKKEDSSSGEQYEDDFQMPNLKEEDLYKTKIKGQAKDEFDSLNIDSLSLECSNYPSKPDVTKEQSEIEKEGENQNEKKIEKSSVNISLPSAQTISDNYKYCRLPNEEFKLKENINKTVKTESLVSESEDPFDLIPSIPANSTIARRPLLQSQILKKEQKKTQQSESLKNLPSDTNIRNSGNISINVINPNNVTEKIQSRNDYGPTASIQESSIQYEEQKEESEIIGSSGPNMIVTREDIPFISKFIPKTTKGEQKQPKNPTVTKKESESELQLKLDDEDKIAKTEDTRKNILMLIKNFEVADRKKGNKSQFANGLIEQTLKKVCKVKAINYKSIDQLEKYTNLLQKQIEKAKDEEDKSRRRVDQVLQSEEIGLETPPKLQLSSNLQDSLYYSQSSIKNASNMQFGSKQVENKNSNLEMNMIESMQFSGVEESPSFGPSAVPKNVAEQQQSRKGNEIKQQNEKVEANQSGTKTEVRPSNKFGLDSNASKGVEDHQNWRINANQGINKFDKDDPLNNAVHEMANKSKAEPEEDDDEWD